MSNKSGPRFETFQLLDGAPMTNDILDGVDTTWDRVTEGAKIRPLVDHIIAQFDPRNPAASVPGLLQVREELAALPMDDSVVAEKRAQLDRILQSCLGLEVQTTNAQAEVVPGEMMKLHHSAVVHSSIPVHWVAVRYPKIENQIDRGIDLMADQSSSVDSTSKLPIDTPLTQPYWLREEGTTGLFRVDDPSLIGRPENPPAFPVEQVFEIKGQTLVIPEEVVQVSTNSASREVRRHMEVIPPVSLNFSSDIALLAPGTSHPVEVEIVASRPDSNGILQLEVPKGWSVSPAHQLFHLATVGARAQSEFTLTAPPQSATAEIVADAEIAGLHYRNRRVEINYPHIPLLLLQPPAALKAVSLELATRGHTVGYLPGAGDSMPENLRQMGYSVKILDDANFTPEQLVGLDAIVIGVRAFNVRTDLPLHLPVLFAYVENGGTIIAEYNRPDGLKTDQLAPFSLRLSGERVTDENAPVTFLAPDHPVLNTPNKISPGDFDHWVQERGIYFPNQWDDRFTPILAFNDPGESPLKGSLLVAQYGRGYFVYTSLVFFRELPAGIPGAFRLFANLISLGK